MELAVLFSLEDLRNVPPRDVIPNLDLTNAALLLSEARFCAIGLAAAVCAAAHAACADAHAAAQA